MWNSVSIFNYPGEPYVTAALHLLDSINSPHSQHGHCCSHCVCSSYCYCVNRCNSIASSGICTL